jgi:hypothetical protein
MIDKSKFLKINKLLMEKYESEGKLGKLDIKMSNFYSENLIDVLCDLDSNGYVIANTSQTKQKAILNHKNLLDLMVDINSMYGNIMKLIKKRSENKDESDGSKDRLVFSDEYDNEFVLTMRQFAHIMIWTHNAYCEQIFNFLENIVDFKKMWENVKDPNEKQIPLGIGGKARLITDALNDTSSWKRILNSIDFKLRNSLTHFDFKLDGDVIIYWDVNSKKYYIKIGKLMKRVLFLDRLGGVFLQAQIHVFPDG